MTKKMVWAWLLLLWSAISADSLRYQDLRDLGVACSPRDTCVQENRSGFRGLCQCDNFCTVYDDCCIDVQNRHQLAPRSESFLCWPLTPIDGVYLRDSCPSDWSNRYIRRRCENNSTSWADPYDHLPLTSTRTQISYKNYYCAICNNDITHSTLWKINVNCESVSIPFNDMVFNRPVEEVPLKYNAEKNEWGITLNATMYASCEIKMLIPDSFTRSDLRSCYPNMIKRCASNWVGDSVREKCGAYTAVTFGPNATTYRNVHCAMCNNVKPSKLSCTPDFGGGVNGRPAPFPLLLDFNSDPQAPVGKKRHCPQSGTAYDPFFKKCRNVVCGIPKYVIRNGKCVKE